MYVYVYVCVYTHTHTHRTNTCTIYTLVWEDICIHILMHTLLLHLKTLTLFHTQEKHRYRIYATVGVFMFIRYTVIHTLSLIHTRTHTQDSYYTYTHTHTNSTHISE
jgi:hypothetical protein